MNLRLAYSLCVNLIYVCQSLCKHITRHFIPKLVLELPSFASRSIDGSPCVSYGAGHDTPNGRREFEDMGYRCWVDKLVLVEDNVSPRPAQINPPALYVLVLSSEIKPRHNSSLLALQRLCLLL